MAPGARLSPHRWGCSTGHHQALTYIEVISLARDALMDCAEEFPEAARRIRAACVRILMAKLLTKHLRSLLAPQNARRSMSVINSRVSPIVFAGRFTISAKSASTCPCLIASFGSK